MKENILLIKLNACGKIIQNVMRGLKYALGFVHLHVKENLK